MLRLARMTSLLAVAFACSPAPPSTPDAGTPPPLTCAAPSDTALNFPTIKRGATARKSFVLHNPNTSSLTVFVGAPTSDSPFTLTAGSARGLVTLEGGRDATVEVEFAPQAEGTSTAFLTVRGGTDCEAQTIMLSGTTVDQALTWSPTTVDCGFVPPGLRRTVDVTFSNMQDAPLAVTGLTALEGPGPATAFSISTSRLEVPAARVNGMTVAGTATLAVTCRPTALGPRTGQIRGEAAGLAVVLPARVVGGGPDIDVAPTAIDFGKVAWFAGAQPPSSATRRFTVRNVGAATAMPDPLANLHFRAPAFDVEGANANELEVTLGTLDPQVGVDTATPLTVQVRIVPQGGGQRAWTIVLHTDDLDEPDVRLAVVANVVTPPPCSASFTPTMLAFGNVTAGNPVERAVTIRNNGTQPGEVCLVNDVAVSGDAAFTLVGDERWFELAAGQQRDVTVHAAVGLEHGPGALTGVLSFSISNPNGAVAQVPLAATVP